MEHDSEFTKWPIVTFEPSGVKISATPRISLLETARNLGYKIRSECNGKGKCGKCKVIVHNKNALTKTTKIEKQHLSTSEIKADFRLSCQAHILKDMIVFVPLESRTLTRTIQSIGFERPVRLNPLVKKIHIRLEKPSLLDIRSDLERLSDSLSGDYGYKNIDIDFTVLKDLPRILREANWDVTITIWDKKEIIAVEPTNTSCEAFGIAIDVGTSKIVIYVVDLVQGLTIHSSSIENPQVIYGEDLISRISHAINNDKGLRILQSLAVTGINEALKGALENTNLDINKIYEATVVGNTAMHHFLLGIEPKYLASSPYAPALRQPLNIKATELGIQMNPRGIVHFLPLIAGFVGGDAVADVISSGIYDSDKPSILLDIGTNTEIFVGDSESLFSCSCASGPAFEGGHIKHGMKAVSGAIERITIDPVSFDVKYNTIASEKPLGLCGSAIIDAVAEMLKCRIIHGNGAFNWNHETDRLNRNENRMEFLIVPAEDSATGENVVVTQRDIYEVQLAKAAISAGCSVLMKKRDLRVSSIKSIMFAGAFGSYINPENAKIIGLIPDVSKDKIRVLGNTAITGAKMVLISKDMRELATRLAKKAKYVELISEPDFRSEYASALFFPHRDLYKVPSFLK